MQQVVSFPGLGLEFHLSNIAFHIASKPIYWYGILIMCGVILAVRVCLQTMQCLWHQAGRHV